MIRTTKAMDFGQSSAFRTDPMSQAELDWIKALFKSHKPSSSAIVRRALQVYVRHLDRLLTNAEQEPDGLLFEATYLRSAAMGENVPWRKRPDFASVTRPFNEWVMEGHRKALQGMLEDNHFGKQVRRMYGDIEV